MVARDMLGAKEICSETEDLKLVQGAQLEYGQAAQEVGRWVVLSVLACCGFEMSRSRLFGDEEMGIILS